MRPTLRRPPAAEGAAQQRQHTAAATSSRQHQRQCSLPCSPFCWSQPCRWPPRLPQARRRPPACLPGGSDALHYCLCCSEPPLPATQGPAALRPHQQNAVPAAAAAAVAAAANSCRAALRRAALCRASSPCTSSALAAPEGWVPALAHTGFFGGCAAHPDTRCNFYCFSCGPAAPPLCPQCAAGHAAAGHRVLQVRQRPTSPHPSLLSALGCFACTHAWPERSLC